MSKILQDTSYAVCAARYRDAETRRQSVQQAVERHRETLLRSAGLLCLQFRDAQRLVCFSCQMRFFMRESTPLTVALGEEVAVLQAQRTVKEVDDVFSLQSGWFSMLHFLSLLLG